MPREISGLGNRTKPGYSVTHEIISFILASIFYKVFERDFLAIRPPNMRKYNIARNTVIVIFYQIQATVSLIYEKTHRYNDYYKAQNNTIVGRREQSISSLRSGLNHIRGWSIKTAENIAESASDVKVS
jgi:hypothetical protein